jgi:hypothetical protein
VSKKNKKPKIEYSPSVTKTPIAQAMPDFNAMPPAWRFAKLDLIHPDDWRSTHALDNQTVENIRKRLASFETMTWKQILGADNHHIEIGKLCAGAQRRLDSLQIATDTLVSLRCMRVERLWGIRRENILSLLWWDPNHQVYPVARKN